MAALLGLLLAVVPGLFLPAYAAAVLTWTADDSITDYRSAPATAVAGATTIVFENSFATGNTSGMTHTLTFDTTTPGYNHDVNLNIVAGPYDANNGRHEVSVTLTPGTYRYFCAIPGHSEMTGTLTVTDGGGGQDDTTAPTVSGSLSGTTDAAGHYVGSATVTVAAADSGSGVASVEYQVDDTSWNPYTAPVVVSSVGDHAVQFRATDVAGNVSEVGSVQFRVVAPEPEQDTTPPSVTHAVSGSRDASGNYVGSATVTLTATDSDSGVASLSSSLDGGAWSVYSAPVVVSAVGSHMLHYRAVDNAGNQSAEQMAVFTVVAPAPADTTPPVVSATVSGPQDAAGNYVGSATVTVTATDTESGVASVSYALDGGAFAAYRAPVVVAAVGAHTVRFQASDISGNVSSVGSVAFVVVGNGSDNCPDSDTRGTVIIDGVDTGVPNRDTGDGCTINDLIAEHAAYPTHAAFVRHVESVTGDLTAAGLITSRQAGSIVRAAAASSY